MFSNIGFLLKELRSTKTVPLSGFDTLQARDKTKVDPHQAEWSVRGFPQSQQTLRAQLEGEVAVPQ